MMQKIPIAIPNTERKDLNLLLTSDLKAIVTLSTNSRKSKTKFKILFQ